MKADKKALLAGAPALSGVALLNISTASTIGRLSASLGGNDVLRADVDLSDRRDEQAKLGTQSDVTHIFYKACFDHVEGTPEPIDTSVAMFRNLIDTVVPIATNLEYVHTGSGHKNYGLHKGPARTPAREDAPGITRSMISLICAYAAIRKELGLLFSFPGTEGNYYALYQCTEALQLAKAIV